MKIEPINFTEFYKKNWTDTPEVVPLGNRIEYGRRVEKLCNILDEIQKYTGDEVIYQNDWVTPITLNAHHLRSWADDIASSDNTSKFTMLLLNELYKEYKELSRKLIEKGSQ